MNTKVPISPAFPSQPLPVVEFGRSAYDLPAPRQARSRPASAAIFVAIPGNWGRAGRTALRCPGWRGQG